MQRSAYHLNVTGARVCGLLFVKTKFGVAEKWFGVCVFCVSQQYHVFDVAKRRR